MKYIDLRERTRDNFLEIILKKDIEIIRLNNIINELEKWLKERVEKLDIYGYDDDIFNGIELALQKLKELKGENNV